LIEVEMKPAYARNTMNQPTGQIAIYQTDDGQTQIDVKMEQDSVWPTQRHSVRVLSDNS